MKRYKLKQWYPSLPSWMKEGDVVIRKEGDSYYYRKHMGKKVRIASKGEVQAYSDFWESLNPVLISEEGEPIYKGDSYWMITTNDDEIHRLRAPDRISVQSFPESAKIYTTKHAAKEEIKKRTGKYEQKYCEEDIREGIKSHMNNAYENTGMKMEDQDEVNQKVCDLIMEEINKEAGYT